MTGEVIPLARHRDFNTEHQYHRQPAPGARIFELRAARITRLVAEFEELTRRSGNVPSTILDQVRAGLEEARRAVRRPTAAVPKPREDEPEGDPQPELDDDRLQRMYRLLEQDV